MAAILILLALFTILGTYLYFQSNKRRLPPGPPRLPILGNLRLWTAQERLSDNFMTLAKKYGKIVYLKVGPLFEIYLLDDANLIKEAFSKHEFSGRPQKMLFVKLFGKGLGIVQSEGELWKHTRRFALQTMRDFGVGKRLLEERIVEEARALATEIGNRTASKDIDIRHMFNEAVSNVICSVVFGERYEYTDPEFKGIMDVMIKFFSNLSQQVPENFLPILRFVRPEGKRIVNTIIELDSCLQDFVQKKIQEHRETFDPKNIRDFVDLYLQTEAKGQKNEIITEANIFRSIIDLFLAGTETTSTTLRWLLLFLLHRPDAQTRARKEVLQIVGQSTPTYKDREKMPFLEAVIHETQRLSNIVPVGVVHTTTKDVHFHGYDIPKGAIVMSNLQFIHKDPAHWDRPEEFLPERWLDKNGRFQQNDHFMAFSVGRRVCLGEILARMELFVFAAILLQSYEFFPTEKLPSFEPAPGGVTLNPQAYKFGVNKI